MEPATFDEPIAPRPMPGRARSPSVAVHTDPGAVDAAAWNELLAQAPEPTPFLRHEYLHALHASGSAVARTGWVPQLITLHQDGQLLAGCAAWRKSHSFGEYVFDWAWADAYRRHGLAYYPKLVCAVPFTPAAGSRLLARDEASRLALLEALPALARADGLSSVHLLFVDEADRRAAQRAGWLLRQTVQFHWRNRAERPFVDFDDFLASLQRDKRKKIAQERRRVAEAGVRFEVFEGAGIDEGLWDFFHDCYVRTYAAHQSTPYLTRDFFARLQRDLPQPWVLFVATLGGERIAASLLAVDAVRGHAWGRYWGCTRHVPLLHFEACYYQPLAWCIARGLRCFEGGAQGEHKMARGLLPTVTHSAHWLAHPAFADAVARYLQREGAGIDGYVDELRERNPYRQPDGPGGAGPGPDRP
jgi:hypothetical protein